MTGESAASGRVADDVGMAGPAGALEIGVSESLESLVPIAGEWQSLLEASTANGIFLTWEWVRLWWQVYGGPHRLLVLTARRDGRLVGIAPLMVARARRYGLRGPRVLMMIGEARGTLAERFAIIAERGSETEVTAAFVRHLEGPLGDRWDLLRFARLEPDTRPTEVLVQALESAGLSPAVSADRGAPFASLPASMDEFLAGRSSNFRSQYRGSVRKLERLGDVRLRLAGRDIGVDEAMDTLGKLHRARFDADASSSFRSSRYLTFHSQLAAALERRGWLWLAILEVDGRPVAARYDYVYAGKIWCMQGGWDPDYSSARPGMVLTGAVFEWAIAQGIGEYDFLCGGEDYKYRWASGERTLVRIRVANRRTLIGRCLPAMLALKRLVLRSRPGAGTPAKAQLSLR